ncbi:MAG: 5'-methylthioadenosine/S-adenosylhomocysteine nucleosidase [Alphaproteobacteria bacterium]|jgi:adenosylhomocysteine nucleosidase|nr:5'-methylthioadenosine/S-adenosylhomocysteine nucleosidase [Alphaproteobacteria bacterium]MBU1550840.1 5'-methylthioadenosine/S-adenosylhomocysteine nucleosidase [Alphaproteobacteria bacterium]MBU2338976.1 5'-methylthioadenosine/S-adenosylhomocysteine nucleosidase [Alphaproteobacteria bacterium]MBU2387067.1 5'-methylthioadenosine/S-adenosylhomocysteine nucleosidase [Alphaproteobacteria bacterium]MDY6961259.1 5'-methylthioadenosine/S-adenosylhomocysteine nucleosidase [Pseudomonadota bacterium
MKFACLLLSTMALSAAFSAPAAAAEQLDDKPRIAVMSAFEPEWKTLLTQLSDAQEHVLNGRRFVTGSMAGKDVVLFLSGVSMVNAAMTTQQALDHFDITSIVFSGIAGGVDPSLSVGDVVVSDQWGQYLEAIFARESEGTFAIPPFLDTQFPNFGMIYPNESEVVRDGSAEPEDRFWFPVDGKLLETARQVASEVTLAKCAGEGRCLSTQPKVLVGGNGVSGPAFVDNAAFREFTFDTFQAKVLDMESAATAHVAYSNGVPFIAFRSLSDLAGGGEGENEMGTFFALASENSAKVVQAFLAALP